MSAPVDPILLAERLRSHADPALGAADREALTGMVALCLAQASERDIEPHETIGLDPAEFDEFLGKVFPHLGLEGLHDRLGPVRELSEEELCLRRLLGRFTSTGSWLEGRLVRILARRCLEENHLWQDLGLASREELSGLIARHFEPLAQRNFENMRWKKFLYRAICLDDAHGICTSPTCGECTEFETCFGDESGASLLARNARSAGVASRP